MIFTRAEIDGAWILDIEPREDPRGFFARTWCRDELAAHGLETQVAQESVAFNARAGTLRGMHYLRRPRAETKLVRCLRGSLHAVLLDLRPESPTFRLSRAFDLTADNHRAVYVPATVALGYLTLVDATEIGYWISEPYSAAGEAGVRWDDPAFGLTWPAEVRLVSQRDQEWPPFHAG